MKNRLRRNNQGGKKTASVVSWKPCEENYERGWSDQMLSVAADLISEGGPSVEPWI